MNQTFKKFYDWLIKFFEPRYKIYMYATFIMITILLCMEVAWGCVDCDLNKKAFEKQAKVISVEVADNCSRTLYEKTCIV